MIKINQRDCMAAEKAAVFVNGFIEKNKRVPSGKELKGAQEFAKYNLILYSQIECMDSRCRLDTIPPPSSHAAFPYVIMDNSEVPLILALWSKKCNRALSPSEIYVLGGVKQRLYWRAFLYFYLLLHIYGSEEKRLMRIKTDQWGQTRLICPKESGTAN